MLARASRLLAVLGRGGDPVDLEGHWSCHMARDGPTERRDENSAGDGGHEATTAED